MRRMAWACAWAVILAGCTVRPDLSRLPPLRLRAPGEMLRQVEAGRTLSGSLATACASSPGRRLVGVVVDNDPHARPQSGLSFACLVYEIPTEARIPRLLAVFNGQEPARVGPVRSVRPAFLEIAQELDAVVAHAGQSLPAFQWIRAHRYPVINEFWTPQPFWRTRDRRMPHNLYGSVPRIREAMRRRGYERPTEPLRPASLSYIDPQGPPAGHIRIGFSAPFRAEFTYRDGRYLRATGGRPHLDALTGRPAFARAVIVQFVPWRGWRSGKVDVSEVGVVGEGRALVFAYGQVVEGRWHKPSEASLTAFTDAQGRGLRLPSGPVWVVLAPLGTLVTYAPAGP
ncbi:MAG: DUF3048 domain-containing protein [Armatimonadota bacterium]|nr:DUF3048 domain-containing protein [Armatimonadota bacterium]MDR7444567.1 DUF3048 domain-containing protein [Armatimonadota bacterium]MDR7570335.1 DUF3048 domain-containing protein [Armatimonadota bacterium]MDR7615357.1 DUF3048 domain-containing protein [Armatimonadota bacterium]